MILKDFYFMLFSTSLAFEVAIYKSTDYMYTNDSTSIQPVRTVKEKYDFKFKMNQRLNVEIRLKNKPSDVVASINITYGESTLEKLPEPEVIKMTKCRYGHCYGTGKKILKTPQISVGIELKNEIEFNWSKYQIILQGTSDAKDDSDQLCLKIRCIMEIDLKNIYQVLPLPAASKPNNLPHDDGKGSYGTIAVLPLPAASKPNNLPHDDGNGSDGTITVLPLPAASKPNDLPHDDGKGSDGTLTGMDNASQQSSPSQDNMLYVYIVSSVVVLAFVLLLAIYIIVKKIRRRNQAGMNTHLTSNEILYADLSFTNGNNNSQSPVLQEESPYAQIIGVLRPKT